MMLCMQKDNAISFWGVEKAPFSVTPLERKKHSIARRLFVHELDGRPRRMRQDRAFIRSRADLLHRLVRHIINGDSRKCGATAVLLGLVDEGAAPATGADMARATSTNTSSSATRTRTRTTLDRRDRRRRIDSREGARVVVQLGEGLGEVLGVDLLVRGVLEAHLPAVGRAGRRRDEEQLPGVGQLEVAVLVAQVQRGVLAEVDAAPLAHDGLPVPDGPHLHGGLLVQERHDDAAEGLQGRPGRHGRRLRDQLPDRLQVVGPEDVHVVEVGDQERVGRWCGLGQWREAG